MIRIGIVGAENSHSVAISKTLNIAKRVPGFRVVAIWGETDKFARDAAKAGQIPAIVKRPADMIGEIDAVIVDHRHAKYHLPAAEPFLKAKLPMFIDKPFCYRLAEGKSFLARARRAGVPVTSNSSVPLSRSFASFLRAMRKAGEVRCAAAAGPCDLESKHGGIFFYGIHQADMLVEAFGTDIAAVAVHRVARGKDAVASVFFRNGPVVSMHCLTSGKTGFQISAATDTAIVSAKLASDPNPYLTGIRRFCKMFKTGVEPLDHRRLLAPVAMLEAMERSTRTGKLVSVAKC